MKKTRATPPSESEYTDILLGDTQCRVFSSTPFQTKLTRQTFASFITRKTLPQIEFYLQTQTQPRPAIERIQLSPQQATISISNDTPMKEFSDAIKMAFGTLLPTTGGIVLHASNVELNGHGYIFVGPPGMGKSTISRLSPEGRILGDDSAVISKKNNAYRLFISPFQERNQTTKEIRNIPIHGIYILHQAKRNRIQKARDPLEAFRHAWFIEAHPPHVQIHKQARQPLWQVALDIATDVPVYDLWFKPDVAIWKLLS